MVSVWRRALCAAVFACGSALLAPSFAVADSLAISSSADPTEEVQQQLFFVGDTDFENLYVKVKASSGQPCAATAATDSGSFLLRDAEVGPETFAFTLNYTPSTAAERLICAWLAPDSAAQPTAAAQLIYRVRKPRSSITPQPPAEVAAGAPFQLRTVTQGEVSRFGYEEINAPGVPCAPTTLANPESSVALSQQPILGGPTVIASTLVAPARAGTYTICGYVQERADDPAPESRSATALVVFSPLCRKATADLAVFSGRAATLARELGRPTKLRRGSRGRLVKKVQRRLHVKPTGRYTRTTAKAVKRFQRRHHLKRTGVVDGRTGRAMGLRLFPSAKTRATWKRQRAAALKSRAGAQRAASAYCR